MSLTCKEIECLLNFINEDTCGSQLTFEQISNEFNEKFSKENYLSLANSLVLLLQNRDLLVTCQQRLIIFYLFHQMYPFDLQTMHMNPFAPIVLSLLTSQQVNPSKYFHWTFSPISKVERLFLNVLLEKTQHKDLCNKTPNDFLQMNSLNINEQTSKLQNIYHDLPLTSQCYLSAVIDDPTINPYGFDRLMNESHSKSNEIRHTIEELLSNNVMNKTIHPEYLRLVPPLHECQIDELTWLSPKSDFNLNSSLFSWDTSMCCQTTNRTNNEIHSIMTKAYQRGLDIHEQKKLLDEFETNPNIIHQLDLTPAKLPNLIEHNLTISIQCLLKLIPSEQMTDYLQSLIHMSMSLHSIEVVNHLTTTIALPSDFIQEYILACIQTCEQTEDKRLQTRFVRLLTVFIQSLIRNKVLDIKELFCEVQNFCLEFRQIKEASALFQLLKTFNEH